MIDMGGRALAKQNLFVIRSLLLSNPGGVALLLSITPSQGSALDFPR
jgi:hypothetical protein